MKIKYPQTYIVYDIESTGLDTTTAEAIEIGCIKVVKGEIVETREWLVEPSEPISDKITELTGITNEMLEEALPAARCWAEFIDYIKGYVLVGHNISRYDNLVVAHQVVKHHPDLLSLRPPFIHDWIDTAALYKAYQMDEEQLWRETHQEFAERILGTPAKVGYRLTAAYQELCPEWENHVAHRALGDCRMTLEVYRNLIV